MLPQRVVVTDEDDVLEVERAYDAAWCARDLDRLVDCLAPDAVLVNPRGEVARGTVEIRRVLEAFLHGEAAGTEHRSTIDRVAFVTPDVAVVDGRARVALPGDERGSPVLQHAFTDVLRRSETGRWHLVHVRAFGLTSGP